MRDTLRGTSFDTFITDDPDFGWAVHYARDMDSRAYKIAKVEPWVAYAHGEADPDCRYKKVMRIEKGRDEIDAYMEAMRILEGLDK
jgi:hypothetical protein